ncbi:hypothetical protein CH341_31580, partial [Rhodoplanes roseus]
AGTYGPIVVPAAWMGSGTVTVQADTAQTAVVAGSGTNAVRVDRGARLSLGAGVKMQATGGHGCYVEGKLIIAGNVEFGACTYSHMLAAYGGSIAVAASYRVTGGAQQHWYCYAGGTLVCQSVTVTLSGTPAFSVAFAQCSSGHMTVNANAFSGSASGPRYLADLYGVIQTYGSGTSY